MILAGCTTETPLPPKGPPARAEIAISREFPASRNYFPVRPKKFPVRRRREFAGKYLVL
jgi:hypothetical protein